MRRTQRWLVLTFLAVGTVAVMFLIWNTLMLGYSETQMDASGKSAELIAPSVLEGKAISKPEPKYPWLAQAVESSGDVAVDVVIDESGKVISAKAVSGPVLLKRASVGAAYKARFTPTLLSGQPVKVKGLITYKFRLE